MKLIIDTNQNTLTQQVAGTSRTLPLYSDEAFLVLSQQWLRTGWNQKYTYAFTWMGRPVIQLPEDLVRVQEVIYRVKPEVIVEPGVAHGGSLIFYASLFQAMGRGRVIGVDIEIRPQNRHAIKQHELSALVTLVEGDSVASNVVAKVRSLVRTGETVMVLLDSCHTKQHVSQELEAYHDLVSPGSYIAAADGIMKDLHDVPRGQPDWVWDNPAAAAAEFAERHTEFVLEQPTWSFNESSLRDNITYWHGAWLRRRNA